MNTHADKTQENQSQSVSRGKSRMLKDDESTYQFVDNKPEAVTQRRMQEMANSSPQALHLRAFKDMANNSLQSKQAAPLQAMTNEHSTQQQPLIKKKENNTGFLAIRHVYRFRNGKDQVGKKGLKNTSFLMQLGKKETWTMIDLRPLKKMLKKGLIKVDKGTAWELNSYDLFLISPNDSKGKINR